MTVSAYGSFSEAMEALQTLSTSLQRGISFHLGFPKISHGAPPTSSKLLMAKKCR